MVMNALRNGATAGIMKFALSGLLVLAAGGLVLTDAGGFFRNGVFGSDLAKAGDRTISVREFDALASRNLRRLGMSTSDAYKAGYLREMLNGEIRSALLAQKAGDLGVLVGTPQVADKLRNILAPMTGTDQSPQDVLKQILVSQGLSEHELASSIRGEMTVSILSDAIRAGIADVSQDMLRDLAEFENEKRAVEFIVFKDSDYEDSKKPADEQLLKMYETLKESFAKPELRDGQLIIIGADEAAQTIEEEEIRASYDHNIDQYARAESRVIEQALLRDEKDAEAVAAAVKGKKSLKESVREVTGNTTDYLPAEAVAKDQLPEALQEAVFSGAEGDVIGPVKTALGIQIAVIKSIVPAHTQSYEDVKSEIAEELKTARQLDAKYDQANLVDDLLASGAAPEDVKEEIAATIKDIPAVNSFGQGAGGKPALEGFGENAQKIIESLFGLGGEGESSPVFELPDGRMAVVYLRAITPKSYQAFEEVKPVLEKRWMEDQRRVENKLQVLEILSTLQSEKSSFADAARTYKKQTQKLSGLTRTQEPKDILTYPALMAVFEAPKDELFVLDIEGGAAIARVTAIEASGALSPEGMAKRKPVLVREMENEAYTLYMEAQRLKYGASINERLLAQTYDRQSEQP
ncbi:MAG: peptidyl-prolyl cis-trans isomerase [Alphaproteobacteria bacterium]|nr:peptidyl-prolyl cis-trans isomerase [Alphaproteobacteria bacterium]